MFRKVAIILILSSAFAWQNGYDQQHQLVCGGSESIYGVRSQHNNYYEDRRWEYRCRALPSASQLGSCGWHNNVNQLDQQLAFRCPGNQVIIGVRSQHSNYFNDRVFSFRCCNLQGKSLDRCQQTGYINQFDGYMDYMAPFGQVIVGFASVHANYFEDRRWQVDTCYLS